MKNPLSLLTRLLIQFLLMRPDVLTVEVMPWDSDDDGYHSKNDAPSVL